MHIHCRIPEMFELVSADMTMPAMTGDVVAVDLQ